MVRFPFAMASEIPVWKKLKSGNYYVGHVDLNLIDEETFFVADLKDDEVDIIKSLIQITSYGINQKRLIFSERKNIDPIMFKCIAFTKNELWVFNPETLRHDIIKFTRYANSLREKNLKSLPFSKREKRTDLLEDIEKTVFFLQNIIDNDDKNDLDE